MNTEAIRITTESLDNALNNIQSKYTIVDDLTSNFAQSTFVAVLDKKVNNSGILKWKKPGRFFIEYTGEQAKLYISNNKKMWVYVPGDTQVEVYKVSDKTISKEVLEFMRGFVDIKKNFKITGWKKTGRRTEFDLVPRFGGAPYAKLKCHFGGDYLLDKVVIYNLTGNISTYNFSNIRINTGLTDNTFKFNKPKGVKTVSVN